MTGETVDSAGVRSAPCSGRRLDDGTCPCGHPVSDHDELLICRSCHGVCAYCGQFRDQHNENEWRSCLTDLEARRQETDAREWWRSQQ